jgi:hypothetical protein
VETPRRRRVSVVLFFVFFQKSFLLPSSFLCSGPVSEAETLEELAAQGRKEVQNEEERKKQKKRKEKKKKKKLWSLREGAFFATPEMATSLGHLMLSKRC